MKAKQRPRQQISLDLLEQKAGDWRIGIACAARERERERERKERKQKKKRWFSLRGSRYAAGR